MSNAEKKRRQGRRYHQARHDEARDGHDKCSIFTHTQFTWHWYRKPANLFKRFFSIMVQWMILTSYFNVVPLLCSCRCVFTCWHIRDNQPIHSNELISFKCPLLFHQIAIKDDLTVQVNDVHVTRHESETPLCPRFQLSPAVNMNFRWNVKQIYLQPDVNPLRPLTSQSDVLFLEEENPFEIRDRVSW